MKKTFFFCLLLTSVCLVQAQEVKTINLSGTTPHVATGKVYLQDYKNKIHTVIDSAEIVNGTFSFSTSVPLPEIYSLTFGEPTITPFLIFPDGNPFTVALDSTDAYRHSIVEGSALQEQYVEFHRERPENIDSYIRRYPGSLAALFVYYRYYSYRQSPEQIRQTLGLFDDSLQETPYIATLNELADALSVVDVGKTAPDFTLQDPEGTTFRLSDYTGKGYVLVDFWASWCPPCRKENPNLVEAYRKYHDQGFEIIGVTLDDKQKAWVNAIQKDGLPWIQGADFQSWNGEAVKSYGVRLIPSSFVIDPQGTIVAKNVKGAELQDFLKEIFED